MPNITSSVSKLTEDEFMKLWLGSYYESFIEDDMQSHMQTLLRRIAPLNSKTNWINVECSNGAMFKYPNTNKTMRFGNKQQNIVTEVSAKTLGICVCSITLMAFGSKEVMEKNDYTVMNANDLLLDFAEKTYEITQEEKNFINTTIAI